MLAGVLHSEAMTEKPCSKCGKVKPLIEFHRHRSTGDNHSAQCKQCTRERNAKWKLENPDKVKEMGRVYFRREKKRIMAQRVKRHDESPRSRNESHIRRTYGLTLEEYDAMHERQDNRCLVCKEKTKLHVDHCHSSGKVRGLLCFFCNAGIGMFKDDPRLMKAAIRYLESGDK